MGMGNFLEPEPARGLTVGKITEVSALTPVKFGRVPDERRTYEERLRFVVERMQTKHDNAVPSELNLIKSLHFGRITIIRPEQYLQMGQNKGIHLPEDDYPELGKGQGPRHRTWVLTQVVFDGDIKAYFRDIAVFLTTRFDAVYANCEEYPGTADFEAFWNWIAKYQLGSDLLYLANPHLSVAAIRRHEDFRKRFDRFLARVRPADGSRPASMDELFDDFVRESLQYPSGFPEFGGFYSGAAREEEGKP